MKRHQSSFGVGFIQKEIENLKCRSHGVLPNLRPCESQYVESQLLKVAISLPVPRGLLLRSLMEIMPIAFDEKPKLVRLQAGAERTNLVFVVCLAENRAPIVDLKINTVLTYPRLGLNQQFPIGWMALRRISVGCSENDEDLIDRKAIGLSRMGQRDQKHLLDLRLAARNPKIHRVHQSERLVLRPGTHPNIEPSATGRFKRVEPVIGQTLVQFSESLMKPFGSSLFVLHDARRYHAPSYEGSKGEIISSEIRGDSK